MNNLPTETNESNFFDYLFEKYYAALEEKINKEIITDLGLVKKYKAELAKSYEEVKGQRNTLIGCMQEILERQEELLAIQKDLIKVITGKYPESRGRITA